MSIRAALEEAVTTAEAAQPAPATPEAEAPVVETPIVATPETEEQKVGRTAGRARDEHGRLLPGKAEKAEPIAAPTEPEKPKLAPPSSWKKDHHQSWDKIAAESPQLAEYLMEREKQFQSGVSTYKQEYERVKPLEDVMQQFMPDLQRSGIRPEQFIAQLGNAHQMLLRGSPQEKLQMFAKLSQDYGVPLQALYDPQAQQQYLSQQMVRQPQQDVAQLVEQKFVEISAKNDLQQFQTATNAEGKPLYPHYETVRNTMAQLLDANLASDLKSAYDKAIRMHDDIWTKEQEAKQLTAQSNVQKAQAAQVAKAKAAAISPKTGTPSSGVQATSAKGIRAALENAVDSINAEGGRV